MAQGNDPVRAERDRDILIDRKNGWTYTELSEKYNLSTSTLHKIITKHIEEAIKPAADELRQFEIERLEGYRRALTDKIAAGDPKAIDTAIKVSESLRKLTGVDASTKIEVEHSMPSDQESRIAEMLRKASESFTDESE